MRGSKSGRVAVSAVEELLMQEIQGFMGKGRADEDLPTILAALEPMWLAMEKNEYGNLGTSQVRYALERFFLHRHGWHLEGLEVREAANVSDPHTKVSRKQIPSFLMHRFEESFGHSGLSLQELAIFAATLEHLIHDDSLERLDIAYGVLGLPVDALLNDLRAQEVMELYMMSIFLGKKAMHIDKIDRNRGRLRRGYPIWVDTYLWLHDVRHTLEYLDRDKTNPFLVRRKLLSRDDMERWVTAASTGFGRFQDSECQKLRNALLDVEDRETGRVYLKDFYRVGLYNDLNFKESQGTLRSIGALDGAAIGEPRVIISNYILSPLNCIADTGLYSVCCVDDCERLMSQVEMSVAAPEATVQKLVEIVSRMPSPTVDAPRYLGTFLIGRLEAVAEANGGKVPLHGRLFAQWMHAVYPIECPYRHASDSSILRTRSQWNNNRSDVSVLSKNSVRQYVAAKDADYYQSDYSYSDDDESTIENEDLLMADWSAEEMLFSQKQQSSSFVRSSTAVLGCFLIFLAVAAAITTVARRNSLLLPLAGKISQV